MTHDDPSAYVIIGASPYVALATHGKPAHLGRCTCDPDGSITLQLVGQPSTRPGRCRHEQRGQQPHTETTAERHPLRQRIQPGRVRVEPTADGNRFTLVNPRGTAALWFGGHRNVRWRQTEVVEPSRFGLTNPPTSFRAFLAIVRAFTQAPPGGAT
jgi:hypothetical protein